MSSSFSNALQMFAGFILAAIVFGIAQPALDLTGAYDTAIGGAAYMWTLFGMQQNTFIIVLVGIVIFFAFILPALGFEDASTMFKVGSTAMNKIGKQPKQQKQTKKEGK